MQIERVRIKGFRGIRETTIWLGQHACLVGPNNSGKTTIVEAIALLFGRDRLVRTLTEHDFFGSNPGPADRIVLLSTLSGFHRNSPEDNPDWFMAGRAIPKWLDPETRAIHPIKNGDEEVLVCEIGFAARFDRDSLEVETRRYFHDDDDAGDPFDEDTTNLVPITLIREVGLFLVPAARTWDRTISFASELFRRIVATLGGPPAETVLAERDHLRNPERPLDEDANLREIVAGVNAELASILPIAPALRLRLTGTDSESVLDAVTPHFQYGDTLALPAKRHGSAVVSLQVLLLLLQFARRRAERRKGVCILLEEPELHIPPPLQKRVINRLRSLSSQTLVTTHSAVVAGSYDARNLRVLLNEAGTLTAPALLLQSLPADAPNWKRELYIGKRQETVVALMHNVVLVPEGRTDFEWIRLLVDALELRDGAGALHLSTTALVGIIPTHQAMVPEVVDELRRVHTDIVCLVDGDAAGDGYIERLLQGRRVPKRILQWPAGWTMEHIIGWIVGANADVVLRKINAAIGTTIHSNDALVAALSTGSREGGLKSNIIAYESIANILAEDEASMERMRAVLKNLFGAASAREMDGERWPIDRRSQETTQVLRYQP